MPVIGVPAFNAVAILRVDPVSFANANVELKAHAAFVNTETGKTYGHTACSRWSKSTLDKLAELRAAMEEDVADMVFDRQPASSGVSLQQQDPGGIGEELGGKSDADQV